MSLKKLQIILIYFTFLFLKIKSYIILPFKSTDEIYFSQLSKNEISINNKEIIKQIFLKHLNNVLYTDLLIGEPIQKATTFLSQEDYGFNFYEEHSIKELTELGSQNYFYFSKNKSKSIISTESYNYEHGFWSYISHEDYLYLFKFDENEIFELEKFEDIKPTKTDKKIQFIYSVRNSSKMTNISDFINIRKQFEDEQDKLRKLNFTNFSYFNLGIQYGNNNRKVKSFKDELYSKKEIINKQWNIYYINTTKLNSKNNNSNAFLVLGSSPHLYFSNIFKENEQFSTYSEKVLFNNKPFLSFYDIYTKIDNKAISLAKFDKSCEINFNLDLIRASWQVKTILEENYFVDLIKQQKCFEARINKSSYSYYIYYYCDKNKITNEEIKNFPGVFFHHIEFSYIFELNSDDLFQIFGDVIIFKIIFDTSNTLVLGKPFLTKYLLSFNDDNKKIYFYNKNYGNENIKNNGNEKNKYLNLVIIIIAIVGVALFGILGFFIGKCFFNKKKKVSHELDDLEDEKLVNDGNSNSNNNEDKLIP